MSLGIVLDIAIGLIFTYLLLGMIGSAFQELVSTVSSLRGRYLLKGISQLLGDNNSPLSDLYKRVSNHPLVKTQGKDTRPSYVSAAHFTMALLHQLGDETQAPRFSQIENSVARLPEGPARQSLITLLIDAQGDLDKLRNSIAKWFDEAMDRVSGSYKRFSHYLLLAFGFAAAVIFNIDSIHIASTLWREPSMRAMVVASATAYADANKTLDVPSPSKPQPRTSAAQIDDSAVKLQAAIDQLGTLPVPIGWADIQKELALTKLGDSEDCANGKSQSDPCRIAMAAFTGAEHNTGLKLVFKAIFMRGGSGGAMLIGWLITALATALGAPFWFDLLQNALRLRNAGPRPERGAVEPSSTSR